MDIADRVSKPPRSKARGPLARIADISETRFWAYYLLLPSIIVILAVVLYPTLWGISLSFREMRLNRLDLGTGFVGLKHYYAMAADPVFWLALQNTVVWTVGAVVGELAAGARRGVAAQQGVARVSRSIGPDPAAVVPAERRRGQHVGADARSAARRHQRHAGQDRRARHLQGLVRRPQHALSPRR